MRIINFTFAVAFAGTAFATNFQSTFNWAERADELGIVSAHLALVYSLTDRCEFTAVEVKENSSPELFTAEAVAEIIHRLIGPFDTVEQKFVLGSLSDEFRVERIAVTRRLINWRTEYGHRFVACYLDSSGNLVRAEYIDGHMPPSKVAEDKPVLENLSELGTMRQEVEFRIEE